VARLVANWGVNWRKAWVLPVVALALVALAACYNNNTGETDVLGVANFKLPAFPETGSHAVIVFSEMHYSPAYKVQEGPRLLPPEGSVPIGGPDTTIRAPVEILYTADEYPALTEPEAFAASYDATEGAELYRVNCMVCHGESMRGDGVMMDKLLASGKSAAPANMMDGDGSTATGGELFAWISFGSRTGFALAMVDQPNPTVMPVFRSLLTEEDRWHLVQYIFGEQGR
jgi:mono/diheme cytochrome c family protein